MHVAHGLILLIPPIWPIGMESAILFTHGFPPIDSALMGFISRDLSDSHGNLAHRLSLRHRQKHQAPTHAHAGLLILSFSSATADPRRARSAVLVEPQLRPLKPASS
jgi:hypothetical protein